MSKDCQHLRRVSERALQCLCDGFHVVRLLSGMGCIRANVLAYAIRSGTANIQRRASRCMFSWKLDDGEASCRWDNGVRGRECPPISGTTLCLYRRTTEDIQQPVEDAVVFEEVWKMRNDFDKRLPSMCVLVTESVIVIALPGDSESFHGETSHAGHDG